MLSVFLTNQFKKDVKKIARSGNKDIAKLKTIINNLENELPLDKKHFPHPLTGNWKDHHECHIEPDWLLIYRIDQKEKALVLVRTGSHSILF